MPTTARIPRLSIRIPGSPARFPVVAALAMGMCLSLLAAACSSDDVDDAISSGQTTATTASGDTFDDGDAPGSDTGEVAGLGERSEIYADPANWLCRPDIAQDACDVDLDATLVHMDGTTEPEPFEAATAAEVDCFYVYPTVSTDQGENSDLLADPAERGVTAAQAARFAEVCNVYAPMYRQIPLGALTSRLSGSSAGEDEAAPDEQSEGSAGDSAGDSGQGQSPIGGSPGEIAYGDVREAFLHYLAEYNDSRPFVLIGHSQGAAHLAELVAQEIDDNDDVRGLMSSAMLIGGAVAASGAGAYDNVGACENPTDRGCVISYSSFYAGEPPPADSFFGRVRGTDEGRAICTNPADPASDGAVPLQSYFQAGHADGAPEADTPFIHYDGLVTGRCASDDTFDWLEITDVADGRPGLPTDLGGRITPQWGAHLSDVNLAQGDLIELVRSQNDLG